MVGNIQKRSNLIKQASVLITISFICLIIFFMQTGYSQLDWVQLTVWPDFGVKVKGVFFSPKLPKKCHSCFSRQSHGFYPNEPKKSPNIWATFAGKAYTKKFQKSK